MFAQATSKGLPDHSPSDCAFILIHTYIVKNFEERFTTLSLHLLLLAPLGYFAFPLPCLTQHHLSKRILPSQIVQMGYRI
jgi:hypothetical protein